MTKKLFSLFFIFSHLAFGQNESITVSGFVKEKQTQELLPSVSIYLENQSIGTSSNAYGFYSISLPKNAKIRLVFSFVGYEKVIQEVSALENIEVNVELSPSNNLDEVVVSANKEKTRESEKVSMSQISIPLSQIKKIPAFLGEKDVLKVLQLMPGVQKGTEGQAGIYVRGGGPDQNLLILDEATVYNANHLFGFFSVFNGDALKSVELTKGGFPARYGGRLSSVIEMQMKDGNKEKFSGEGGIGLISSRLTLEGPLGKKKKASFLFSGRRTYLDILAKPFINKSIANESEDGSGKGTVGYFFHDINAKINYNFSSKDKLYLSGFFGQDKFYLKNKQKSYNEKAGLAWGNSTATLRWNHLYNQKLFSNALLIFSNYNFNIKNQYTEFDSDGNKSSDFRLKYNSGIQDLGFKVDFDYYPNTSHTLKFGTLLTRHSFRPSALVLSGSDVNFPQNIKPDVLNSVETGVYLEDIWNINSKFKANYGLRFSGFLPKKASYFRLEPRVSLAYKLAPKLSVKGSYSQMNQYIHLVSNTGFGLPTDLWVPTTERVAPQHSEQFAIGLAKDFNESGYSLTLEAYRKNMGNIMSYKEGASFLELDGSSGNFKDWQDNVTQGKGWSQGVEVLLQKKSGKFSGWAGYTLSWTYWQFPELNRGKKFFPKYDRRHDISLVGIYEVNERITLSAVWVYGTGNALTIPVATYKLPTVPADLNNAAWSNAFRFNAGAEYDDYSPRNTFRAEAYHRLDLAIQFHKQKKNHKRTWEFGLYNAYNRRNPFFYQTSTTNTTTGDPNTPPQRKTSLERVSLMPLIPSFSYNFKF